jgi:hypothetical protein
MLESKKSAFTIKLLILRLWVLVTAWTGNSIAFLLLGHLLDSLYLDAACSFSEVAGILVDSDYLICMSSLMEDSNLPVQTSG